MAAYLTQRRYFERMELTDAEAPTGVDLRMASAALDSYGPFVGSSYSREQQRAFPRSVTLAGDTEGIVPDSVLDACALLVQAEAEGGIEASIESEAVLDKRVTYAKGQKSQVEQRVLALLKPYRRTSTPIL